MICPKCHTVNDDNEKFCKNCGFQLNSSRICPECGKTNDSNSKYCKECGTVLTPVNTFRKQIIEENTKKSFFDLYKVPIICALFIILAVGAVAGMAFYNGSSGDDGLNSIIPTGNDTGFFIDDNPAQAQMQENATNKTNQTMNQTNDTNDSKTLTEKVNNTTDQSKKLNQTNKTKSNKNNKTKTITEKVENKTSPIKNKTSPIKNKTDTDDGKSIIDNKSDSSDKSDKSSDKGSIPFIPIDNKDNKSSAAADDDLNDNDNELDDNDSDDLFDNDTDDLNDSDENGSDDLFDNDTDDLNDSEDNDTDDSLSEIEMEDVPNLALKVSETGYSFSTIEYDGKELTNAQCIYILSEYLLNVESGKSSPIEIKNVSEASSPSGEDSSQTIEKSDYLSIANRVHSWMNSNNAVPNYVGVSQMGEADLSPEKMLELFTQATLNYSVSGDLPESVDI